MSLQIDYKNRCEQSGQQGHFFDAFTMKFFKSRIGASRYCKNGIIIFITSEKPPYGERMFSVRRMELDGNINTIGDFCSMSRYRATKMMNEYADNENLQKL